jgi:hypothetical protein
MRLVMVGDPPNIRVWLEAESPEETATLRACAARGEWTNGRGVDAIARLHALAEQMGHPIKGPNIPPRAAPPCLVVIRSGDQHLHEQLAAIARDNVTLVWDRRRGDRRATNGPVGTERRRHERRRLPPSTWVTGFLVVQFHEPA